MNMRAISHTLALLLCAVALTGGRPARAQTSLDVQATPAFDGNYVPGSWLPLTLTITNSGPPVDVRISAALPADPASYAQDRQLAGGETQRITLYVAMTQETREIRVRVTRGDEALAEQTVAVRPRVGERMLGILAGSELTLSLPRREDLAASPFTALPLTPQSLPDRAEGLGSLGMLIINDIEPESLSPAQIGAIGAWVNAGGYLILGGGPQASPANAWLPAELQAASIGAGATIDDAPLAARADAAGPGQIPGVELTPLPGGVATGPGQAPAWVTRPVGRGRVTQLAFDPGLPALRAWAAAPTFWGAVLQPAIQVRTPFGIQSNVDRLQEQTLAGALTALPVVGQPPVDIFFLILVIYTILIGPVLALLLRRLDRQAWSWLLVPVIALSSGALLMTVALNLRADSRVITQVSLIEDLGGGQARARTYVGILAPQDQRLSASLPPGALTRPVPTINGIYGAIGGVRGTLLQESERIPISIDAWKQQGLVAEQLIDLTGISAELQLDAQGAQALVRNETDQRLFDVIAVYGEQVVRLGDIRPGEEVSRRWPPVMDIAPPGTAISAIVMQDAIAEARLPGRAIERRVQARAAMIDAAVIRSDTTADPGPFIMAWLESSPLDVTIDAQSAARQSLTLLVTRPHIRGSGPVDMPDDWLRVDAALSQRNICFGSQGAGIAASPAPATIALQLPPDLTPLTASALTLTMESANTWPNAGVTTELYDWSRQAWVAQSFDGPGALKIDQPAPYLAQGRLMIRLGGAIDRAGCLYIHTSLQGSLP